MISDDLAPFEAAPMPYEESDIRMIAEDLDHRFAGTSLDPWLGYQPEPSVVIATQTAINRPKDKIIAFVAPIGEEWQRWINHQKRAGDAYAKDNHPNHKITYHQVTARFRGVGPDCMVFYCKAEEKK